MKYEKIWKYRLTASIFIEFGVNNLYDNRVNWYRHWNHPSDMFLLATNGIDFRQGYAWDGPSGPTIDTENSLRASLVHDALYQAIRAGGLPFSARRHADRVFRNLLCEDGMSWLRRWVWYFAVRLFGGRYARA